MRINVIFMKNATRLANMNEKPIERERKRDKDLTMESKIRERSSCYRNRMLFSLSKDLCICEHTQM